MSTPKFEEALESIRRYLDWIGDISSSDAKAEAQMTFLSLPRLIQAEIEQRAAECRTDVTNKDTK